VDIWVESAGLGHVTRQLNLWRALERNCGSGLSPRFLIDDHPATAEAVSREGLSFDVRSTDLSAAFAALANEWRESPPAAFVLDSVNHDQVPESALVLNDPRVYSVVVIDDPNDRSVDCDLLINALPSIPASSTRNSAGTRKLSGTEYLILASDFAEVRSRSEARTFQECNRGFAFFGGADLEDFGSLFLDAISTPFPVKEWTLLLGPAYSNADRVSERVARDYPHVNVVRQVKNMAQSLLQADLAVLAAGNTLAEAAAVGTPSIVFSQNNVQEENAAFFSRTCGVVNIGRRGHATPEMLGSAVSDLASDSDRRRIISKALMQTVDSRGAARVAEIIAAGLNSK
jgi:spore coat polysaccharide biosynthesis predicted glycosyltransferase SpsG